MIDMPPNAVPQSPLPEMKKFSRWMPAAPVRKITIWGWAFLALLLLAVLYVLYRNPYSFFFFAVVGVAFWMFSASFNRNMRKLAAGRADESICTFVRQFNCRKSDPWILRAVYEELSRYSVVDSRPLPIRADDQCCGSNLDEIEWKFLENNLKIDPEDLDDLARTIAVRAGRSMEDAKQNPFYGKVKTVRDLVGFLEHQPKLSSNPPSPTIEPLEPRRFL